MKCSPVFFYHYLAAKIRAPKITHDKIRGYLRDRTVIGKNAVQSAEAIHADLARRIRSGKPFFAGRFGAVELFGIRTFDFEIKTKYNKALLQMQTNAGFFPPTEESGKRFKDLMLSSISQADVMGIWMLPFEAYYLKKYGKRDLETTYLLDLEPWSVPENPWSAALKGKKVLVIHPFAQTIEKQYHRRETIFPGTDILPQFELKTLKAVQTAAGEQDERFANWFDALEWMYQEALKIDFDVAIIGCGAYGFPLAAKLRQAGKQVVHLAGATQLLFGIKGKRWEENEAFAYVQKFFNENWVFPSSEERPRDAGKVENGCYW